MAKYNSEEINFQFFVDEVKQKKMSWNFFINSMQDQSYSDINKLRHLTELTMNNSDMDKLKYLNEL